MEDKPELSEFSGVNPDRQPTENPESMTTPGSSRDLLVEQNRALDLEVKTALAAKIAEISAEVLPTSSSYFIVQLEEKALSTLESSGYSRQRVSIGEPTQRNEETKAVDLAFNVVGAAKQVGRNPVEAAQELAGQLDKFAEFSKATNAGPFVNIEIDYRHAAPLILSQVEILGDKYGHFRDGEPKVVIVDYSSPNVAKNMTLAHLRSTIIGHTLTKIHTAAGNIPFGVNHIGDWGTQFGNIIYQYQQEMAADPEGFKAQLNADPTATLMSIYRKFNEINDPKAADEARSIFLRLEHGDPELVALWTQFRQWSLRDFGPSYARLDVDFDAIQGESFYEDRMQPAVQDALDKEVLVTNDEQAIVFPSQPLTNPTTGQINERLMLDHDGNPRDELIVKPSGGTVYLTRDLAAIRYRAQELGADKILYVIGKEQQAHCMMLFAMAHKLGYVALGGAEHISFGHLNVDGRKMKSRAGKVVLLDEVVDESVAAATSLLIERKAESGNSGELNEAEREIARKIGVSALVFNDLKQDRQKDIEFTPDMAKTLEAGGSTYIQYTDARLTSLLEKAGEPSESAVTVPEVLLDDEKRVLNLIARFPYVVKDAAQLNAPHKIATYLTEFSRSINVFYREVPILKAGTDNERNFRLRLVGAAKQVLANGSHLLHIELPGKM